jgi:hypothetical protein
MAAPGAETVWAQAWDPPDVPIAARFLYPVGFICGRASEAFQEGVVTGRYSTVVHVVNPGSAPVAFAKTVRRALPYQAGLPPAAYQADRLDPGAAMAIECEEIRQSLPASMSASFRTGYLGLLSDRPLNVGVTYSAGPRDGEISTADTETIRGQVFCGLGRLDAEGQCDCPSGLAGPHCEISIAKQSAPTFLRLKWVGIDAPGDIVRSDNDCVSLEVESFTGRPLLAEIEFYGTLNGRPKPMLSPLTSVPLTPFETEVVERCFRDFEGDGGPSDLLELAFSATINARATVLDGLDGAGGRLDRIFAPTGYFHVEAAPELFVPYTAVLYDDLARRESFNGGDYAGRFGFTLPRGGIFVGDTHPDELYDEGGPEPPPDIVPEP